MKHLSPLLLALCLLPAARAAEPAVTKYGDATTPYATGIKGSPGLPLYFTSGSTPGAGAPANMKAQALITLGRLKDNITTAGFTLSDVVFVRAYLAPGADGKVDYAGWNEAWGEMFNTAAFPHKPARTTVAVPLLGTPATLIEIEFVATAAAAPGLAPASDKLGLPNTNAMLKPFGTKEGRIYSGMGIMPGAAMYWTAGSTAGVINPDAPAGSRERSGDMKTQARVTLQKLQANLAAVGLSFKDVVYLRAFLGPDRLDGDKFDYVGWNEAYGEFFNNAGNPHKPARTTITTPTYGVGSATMIEIEIIAAFPGKPGDQVKFDSALNAKIKAYGAPTAAISSGMAVTGGSTFFFSAGAVPGAAGDMKAQALSALEILKGRLAEAGLSYKDVVFLRAYVVPNPDGSVDRAGWTEAYNTYFNNPTQPHKPARTTIPVLSLPRAEWKIELDVIAVAP
jgi:enamine deaminase RidA (YjgF/YER057c/UK114 family)